MPKKIDISEMTHEEVIAYAEKVKQQARDSMELGSVTLKRIGFFCFPIKHSTHTE